MNLWEILKTSKGLPPPDLETLLFARKISGQAVGGSTLKTLTVSGYPCVLEGSAGMPVLDYKIYGNSVQEGTPSPENPVEVKSVGDLVTEGEYAGKYKIPVVVSAENNIQKTTNIYLNEPLRKIGDYADVIDFERGVVERNTIEYVFTGDEPFGHASSDENRAVGSLIFGDIRDISVFFSNMFHAPPYENTEYNRIVLTKGWLYVSLSYELIGGSYYDSDDTKIANIVNWLKERYESGNPLTVVATHKSTTEPISIPSIPTFDGTTIIQTNTEIQPSNMEIKYKARK